MKREFVLLLILVTALSAVFLRMHASGNSVILSPVGEIELKTALPESPAEVNLYRVVGDESIEGIGNSSPDYGRIRYNLPSEEDAVRFAMKALEKYGGLPEDAVLSKVQIEYAEVINTDTGKIADRKPTLIRVTFKRYVDGMPVIGPGGKIVVYIGDNGEIVDLTKIWRKLEYAGKAKIIPAKEAFDRLVKGEVVMKPMGKLKLKITDVELGYFAAGFGKRQEYYTPVWIFHCKDHLGKNVTLAVKAIGEDF
ncbi:two-component system regulatory protein YycI [Archaeoglobus neptunius]|uniref:two-component system regulatory protein YycI n=1 Tax=Archaeoglobus neptunius TaxID=2798580 RepID=UPI0019283F94|nr:two-component system regulatory protein YycI [Archaeoglobus neptunius]